jgi:uncharacterized DUF497 family protein
MHGDGWIRLGAGNRTKCQKHGLAIADVEYVLARSESVILPAPGFEETRFVAVGPTPAGRLAFVVFTARERGGTKLLRPISARYMHRREVEKYGQALARFQK